MNDAERKWLKEHDTLRHNVKFEGLPKCPVGDVEDAEAFVKACIRKSGLRIDHDAYTELAAEGIVILWDLFTRYDPSKDKGPKASFAGYAWYLLPRKIIDVWHKMNPNHVLRTFKEIDEDTGEEYSVRRWVYYEPECSLDERIERFADSDDYELDRYRHVGDFAQLPISEDA